VAPRPSWHAAGADTPALSEAAIIAGAGAAGSLPMKRIDAKLGAKAVGLEALLEFGRGQKNPKPLL
jgi:hypothetical protein